MVSTYAYGHDFGNSNTAGVTYVDGRPYELLMPSAIAEGTLEDLTQNATLTVWHHINTQITCAQDWHQKLLRGRPGDLSKLKSAHQSPDSSR